MVTNNINKIQFKKKNNFSEYTDTLTVNNLKYTCISTD